MFNRAHVQPGIKFFLLLSHFGGDSVAQLAFAMASGAPRCGSCPVCLELVSASEARPEKACTCSSPCRLLYDQITDAMTRKWSADESTWSESDRVIIDAVAAVGGEWDKDSSPALCSFPELFDRLTSLSRCAVVMPCCHVSGTPVCVECLRESGVKEMHTSPDCVARCPLCRAAYHAGFGLVEVLTKQVIRLLRRAIEITKADACANDMFTASAKIEKGIRVIFSVLSIGNSGARPLDIINYMWSLINYNMDQVLPSNSGIFFVDVCSEAASFARAPLFGSAAPEGFKHAVYHFINVPVVRSVDPSESGLRPGDVVIFDEEMQPFGAEAALKGARPGLSVLDPSGQHVRVLPYSQWTSEKIAVVDETPESPYCGQTALYKVSEISRAAPVTVRVRRPLCACGGSVLCNAPIEVEVQPTGALLWSVGREDVDRTVSFLFATGLIQQMPSCIGKIQRSTNMLEMVERMADLLDLVFDD